MYRGRCIKPTAISGDIALVSKIRFGLISLETSDEDNAADVEQHQANCDPGASKKESAGDHDDHVSDQFGHADT